MQPTVKVHQIFIVLNTIWLEIRDSRFRIQDSSFKIQKEKYENAFYEKKYQILENQSMYQQ